METWNESYFFALIHYLYARLFLKEFFLTKNVNEFWGYLFIVNSLFN